MEPETRFPRVRQDATRRRRDACPNTNAGLGLVLTCRAERGSFTPRQQSAGRLTGGCFAGGAGVFPEMSALQSPSRGRR
jgi:hypothetical protein